MRFVVLTLFPSLVDGYAAEGVLGRAVERKQVTVDAVDIRDYTDDNYRSVDDVPFGGGAGMVMKPEPIARAIEAAGPVDRRVLLTPSGRRFEQRDAVEWSKLGSLLLLCGRYEGVDQRIRDDFVDDAVSIGDYVLSGGELGALVVLDAIMRLLPGVLGNAGSLDHESYNDGLLEHPHYTRPAEWRGRTVPDVLLSGHHARIAEWRRRASIHRTAQVRPDLLTAASLTPQDQRTLLELGLGQRGEPT